MTEEYTGQRDEAYVGHTLGALLLVLSIFIAVIAVLAVDHKAVESDLVVSVVQSVD